MKARRILIVDDKEDNLYLLQTLLKGHGYEAISANNGADALEKARRDPPDLIISDILMPVMDGFALCKEWMKDSRLKTIPFIFYTATYTDERDREFALSLGAAQFLVKPLEPEMLMKAVDEAIERGGKTPAAPAEFSAEVFEKEAIQLKQYNATLIRKLEHKMEQLEKANRELLQDIAERKKAAQELRKEKERAHKYFDAAAVIMLVVDSDGKVVNINDQGCDALGYAKGEIVGKNWFDNFVPAKYRAELSKVFHRILNKEEGLLGYYESRILPKDGSERLIAWRNTILKDAAGKATSMLASGIDITDRDKE